MNFLACFLVLCLAWCQGDALAAQPGAKDAVAMVRRAAALTRAEGEEALLQRVKARDSAFVQGDLYLDVRDLKTGVVLAHPYYPILVGQDLLDVPDASGKLFRRDIMRLARTRGAGWVEFLYKHPLTNRIELKRMFLLRVNGVILEAGYYRPSALQVR